jgi:RNA polymerase sigma-70 factor (ECF subfamily)
METRRLGTRSRHGRAGRPAARLQARERSQDPELVETVRLAQAGNRREFERLFERHRREIHNALYRLLGSESHAADLTQVTFIHAYRALPRLRAPEAFVPWLHRIALNLGRNLIRRRGGVRMDSLELFAEDGRDASIPQLVDSGADPWLAVQAKELQERVRGAVASLTEPNRMVVTLHHLEGVPIEEIARMLDCPRGTVKSRLFRARDHLREKLAGLVEH